MPAMTQHPVGTFCWPELATKDFKSALAFYQSLFGWGVKENPMGPDMTYYILTKGEHEVAAGYELNDAMMPGVPPHWGAYVSVTDVDATAAKAKQLGGEVVMEPMDVNANGRDQGRMVVLKDPVGAVFCAWQAKQHHGVGLVGEPGSLIWTQLNTSDTAKSKAFYTQLLGWSAMEMPDPSTGGVYTMWMRSADDRSGAGGMMAMPPGVGAPAHWLTYFGTTDVDATLATAMKGGATTFVPATDIPGMGRFAVLADPQGAIFALFKPNM